MSASTQQLASDGDSISITGPGNTNWQSKKFLDADGLSKIPIVLEDRVVEMYRELLVIFLHLHWRTQNTKHC